MAHASKLAAWGLLTCAAVSAAQDNVCDPGLQPDPRSSEFGYQRRGEKGERCEGLFIKRVSASGLHLVSLTAALTDYKKEPGELYIRWPSVPAPPALAESALHIRASWLRPRGYYQMDVKPRGGDLKYQWEPRIVRALVPPGELGLLASVARQHLGRSAPLYVPVALTTDAQAVPSSDRYRLQLFTAKRVSQLSISVYPVDASGTSGPPLEGANSVPLMLGHHATDSIVPVEIPVSWLPSAGVYMVRLSAVADDKTLLSERFYFLHASLK